MLLYYTGGCLKKKITDTLIHSDWKRDLHFSQSIKMVNRFETEMLKRKGSKNKDASPQTRGEGVA